MEFKATSFKNRGVINIFIFQLFVATVDSFSRVITKHLLISTLFLRSILLDFISWWLGKHF